MVRTCKSLKRIALSLSLLSLAACGGGQDFSKLEQQLENIKSKPGGVIDPIPKTKLADTFFYNATVFRSPFQKPIEEALLSKPNIQDGPKVEPNLNRPKEMLEGFSVESLQMVGTIQRFDEGLFALIADNSGEVHRVIEGNYIGKNHGKIIFINENRIELEEIISDGLGGWVLRPRTITLKDI